MPIMTLSTLKRIIKSHRVPSTNLDWLVDFCCIHVVCVKITLSFVPASNISYLYCIRKSLRPVQPVKELNGATLFNLISPVSSMSRSQFEIGNDSTAKHQFT